MVYGLVAPLWEQTSVLADRLTGRVEDAVYEGSRTSTKLKVMGVDLAVMGEKQSRDADDEVVTYAEPGRGVYQKLIVRDGKLAGAILLGDTSAAPALQQLFDRSTPLPDVARVAALPARRRAGARSRPPTCPTTRRSATATASRRAPSSARCATAARRFKAVCDATRAGTGCGSCKMQVKAHRRGRGRRRLQDDPAAHYYVPGVPLAKRELVAAIKRDEPAQRVAGVRRAGRPAGKTRAARPASPRCSRRSGATT